MRHPYFDHPLAWHTTLASALAEAAAVQRGVFVVYGHERCFGTRGYVEKTLCKDEIVDELKSRFVLLAADSVTTEPAIAALLEKLPKRAPTPVTMYVSPRGECVFSTVNARSPAVLLNDLLQAATALRRP